jgi:hypothetical protein
MNNLFGLFDEEQEQITENESSLNAQNTQTNGSLELHKELDITKTM